MEGLAWHHQARHAWPAELAGVVGVEDRLEVRHRHEDIAGVLVLHDGAAL